MRLFIFGHNQRPEVDSQNTGRDAYERPFGVGTVSVEGQGGANNFRSLSPVNPTGVNQAFVTYADLAGIGSSTGLSTNPQLEPLLDKPSGGTLGTPVKQF